MLTTQMMANGRFHQVELEEIDGRYYFSAPFALKDELKKMHGARWDPKSTRWHVPICRRNNFAIAYLEGKNPYAPYKSKLDLSKVRKVRKDRYGVEQAIYAHQNEFTAHMLQRRHCIIAGEMGTGKSLSLFEAAELAFAPHVWYVGPKAGISSVKLDAYKWNFKVPTTYLTYDELKRVLKDWPDNQKPPRFVCFDESSRLKNGTSQRSQAAFHLAEGMRNAYGRDCYIILMSGSPAPKSPQDWWYQCEIACPGFIAEGDVYKFRDRYAVMNKKQKDNIGFGYDELVCWRDGDKTKCNTCGLPEADHNPMFGGTRTSHQFVPLENEVNKFYARMGGLSIVKFKKDCLDLPKKVYKTVKLRPSLDLLRAAKLVQSQGKTAIEQLTLLRELSDGFQYVKKEGDTQDCSTCKGKRVLFKEDSTTETEDCFMCGGSGTQLKVTRELVEIDSPKLNALGDLLDEYEEDGRLVVYAGFTASIDRICKKARELGWHYIRVDGRGWSNSIDSSWNDQQCLLYFQDKSKTGVPTVFVGQPASAGMGLTLTASEAIVYYSNDFNAESRIQSEDRIHRLGCTGALIIDMLLLPSDKKVLDNLKLKRKLQAITMNEVASAMDSYKWEDDEQV